MRQLTYYVSNANFRAKIPATKYTATEHSHIRPENR